VESGTLPGATDQKLRNKTPVSARLQPRPWRGCFFLYCPGLPPTSTAPKRRRTWVVRGRQGKLPRLYGRGFTLNQDIQGGCMCGAVRYSATTNPANSMVATANRAAARPHRRWSRGSRFAKAEFRFTRGTPLEYESSAEGPAALLPAPAVAAHVRTSRHGGFRGCHHLQPRCTLGVSADASFLVERRCGWVKFGDGLPTFERSRFGDPS